MLNIFADQNCVEIPLHPRQKGYHQKKKKKKERLWEKTNKPLYTAGENAN